MDACEKVISMWRRMRHYFQLAKVENIETILQERDKLKAEIVTLIESNDQFLNAREMLLKRTQLEDKLIEEIKIAIDLELSETSQAIQT
jgi:hypothetical protein